MRLCGALALVLVALVVLAVKAASRPRRRAPSPPDAAELSSSPSTSPPPVRTRPPSRRLPRAAARVPAPPPVFASPAAIGGRLRLPDGVDLVHIVARPNGDDAPERIGLANNGGAFRVVGLTGGRHYTVEFSGDGVRTLKLIGVLAPAEDLDVTLEPRPVLHVAVGFPRGERCPIDLLVVSMGHGEHVTQTIAGWSPECRFEVTGPAFGGQATIVAEGNGLNFEASITIPDQGDPEPICLNPPCRANPLEGLARLRVMLGGVDSSSPVRATIVPVGDPDTRYGCGSSLFTCDVEGLPPGQAYAITASGRNCHGAPVTKTVFEGDNHVTIPCVRAQPTDEPADEPTGEPSNDADT